MQKTQFLYKKIAEEKKRKLKERTVIVISSDLYLKSSITFKSLSDNKFGRYRRFPSLKIKRNYWYLIQSRFYKTFMGTVENWICPFLDKYSLAIPPFTKLGFWYLVSWILYLKFWESILCIFQNLVQYRPASQGSPCPPLYPPTYSMEQNNSCVKEEQHNSA